MKIFIAVLSYDGKMEVGCASSLLCNVRLLEAFGNEVQIHYECGICYLPLARNNAVAAFLDSDCQAIVFVDNDLAFESKAIFKLLMFKNRALVCGAYPYKSNDGGFPINPKLGDDGKPIVDAETGLVALNGGPTGLMAIERWVFEKLRDTHPEWKTTSKSKGGNNVYCFFDTGLLRNDGMWWGEDYEFCNRLRDAGIEMWCYPDIDFHHFGKMSAAGNYSKRLKDADN